MLDFALIASEPIPGSRFKRARHCTFPDATFGFTTQSMVEGFKLPAWSRPNGRLVRSLLRPAHEHDLNAGEQRNTDWPAIGGPKSIGDQASRGGGDITPPTTNTRSADLRWKEEFHAARKAIKSAFSSLAGHGLRWRQIKNHLELAVEGSPHPDRRPSPLPTIWPTQPLIAVSYLVSTRVMLPPPL